MSMKEDHSSSPGRADRHRPAHFKQTPTPAPLPQNYSEFLAQFPLLDVLAGAFYKRLAPSGGLRYVEDAVMAGAGALATDWPRISDGRSLAQVLSYAIKAGVNDIRHFRCHEGRTCSMNDSHERPDATIVDFTTEDFDLLQRGLDGLDPVDRAIVTMTIGQSMSDRDVAKLLDIPPTTLRRRAQKAIELLQECFDSKAF